MFFLAPCKLALKKNFRKSSIFDKQSRVDLDQSVILIEDSFEDKPNISITKVLINKAVDLVSISSESISDSFESLKEGDSKSRYSHTLDKVDQWLTEVEKTEEFSTIHSFKHKSCFDSDNDSLSSRSSISKTSDDSKNFESANHSKLDSEKNSSIEHVNLENNGDIFTPIKNIENNFNTNGKV